MNKNTRQIAIPFYFCNPRNHPWSHYHGSLVMMLFGVMKNSSRQLLVPLKMWVKFSVLWVTDFDRSRICGS